MGGRPAVFFDRDGTLIEEVSYLDSLDRVALFPWTIEALRVLRRAGFALVVITNQAGVARGYYDEAFVDTVHRHLNERFEASGAPVDGFYYCPHLPDAWLSEYRMTCECRKPRPGMLRTAAADLDLDLARSFVVGDRWGDVQAAQNAGSRGLLVRSGYGWHESRHPPERATATAIVDHAFAAASWILWHTIGRER
jgi:D-glycero-D-manno-heptose 1,7-bisphosphate phosphatase